MRSKSRFTTLVLLETRESYLQIRVQSLCTLRCHCRQGPRNIRYHQLAWHTLRSPRRRGRAAPKRWWDARPFCAVVEPGEDTRTLSTSSKCHLRVRRFIEPSHRV